MKTSKIFLVFLALCLVGALSLSCSSETDAESEYQTATIQRGDLSIDITSSGNLAFSNEEELAFEVSGTVDYVLVEVGDSVEEGQTLAKLDDASITSQEEAVAQARLNLQNAEENLEEAQNPYTESDMAQAEAAVANARVALEAAQEALENAENPYTEADIAQAELAVVNAEIALENAQDALDFAEAPYGWPEKADPLDVEQKEKLLTI